MSATPARWAPPGCYLVRDDDLDDCLPVVISPEDFEGVCPCSSPSAHCRHIVQAREALSLTITASKFESGRE